MTMVSKKHFLWKIQIGYFGIIANPYKKKNQFEFSKSHGIKMIVYTSPEDELFFKVRRKIEQKCMG